MNNIFQPKIKLCCSIIEAMEYLAFNWDPIEEEYEAILDKPRKRWEYFPPNDRFLFHDNNVEPKTEEENVYLRKMSEASAKLKILLKNGLPFYADVSRFSDDFDLNSVFVKEGSYFKLIENILPKKIIFKRYLKLKMHLRYPNNHFVSFDNVSFRFSELKEMLSCRTLKEDNVKEQHNPIINYTTPYLDIINEIIQEQKISYENQILKKELEYEIKKKAENKNFHVSERIVNVMATILRLPEMQKGGVKKTKE